MHTQNVNGNTATRKTPERCGQDEISLIFAVQHSLFSQLAGLWNLQLTQEEEENEIRSLIDQLAENVLIYGVTDWSYKKPLVSWDVAYFWIQAQKIAVNVYGHIGAGAVEYARRDMADRLTREKYYRDKERNAG